MLSTVGKYGLKYTKDAPPEMVAAMQTATQVMQAVTSLQYAGIWLVPVIPFGSVIDNALTYIEALLNKPAVIIAKIRKTLMERYSIAFKNAISKRKIAEEKLYSDLKKSQLLIIKEVDEMKKKLKAMQIRLPKIQAEYEKKMALYQQTIAKYAFNAKFARDNGDIETMNYWEQQIKDLDPWLASIILKLTEKITLILDIKFLEMDIKAKEPLTKIVLEKNWNKMAWTWSFMFNVAVPYYPDMPDYPNLPPMPPKIKIPQIIKCIAKGFAKWLATPTVPPLGVLIDATLHCVMNLVPMNIPPVAARIESFSDSLIERMGFCI